MFTSTALGIYGPGIVAGLAVALVCSILSPLVVLKRLSFVGQGISHAAFGGVGIAAVLAVIADLPFAGAYAGQFAIVLCFCLAAGLLIGRLMDRAGTEADSAIGIVLVASMALGAILVQWAVLTQGTPAWRRAHASGATFVQSWESILFGSLWANSWTAAAIAWAVAAIILITLLWFRRPLMFWAFDEAAAPAFGVSFQAMKYLLIVLLTLAIVTSMRLAGVVLATAVLVLPGAAALYLSDRIRGVLALSVLTGLVGAVGGLALCFAASLPPGACIVAVLVVLFVAARLLSAGLPRRTVA
jgi:manganese/iron transport system permease protein/iron/zinc/copper transport system permease protein